MAPVHQGVDPPGRRRAAARLSPPAIWRAAPAGSRQRMVGRCRQAHGRGLAWRRVGGFARHRTGACPDRPNPIACRCLAQSHAGPVARDPDDHLHRSGRCGCDRRSRHGLPRPRNRSHGQRCPLAGAQEHSHGLGHRQPDDSRDAAPRPDPGHRRGLLQGLGRRRHSVRLHHAHLNPWRLADRRLRADDAGLYRYTSRAVSHGCTAR